MLSLTTWAAERAKSLATRGAKLAIAEFRSLLPGGKLAPGEAAPFDMTIDCAGAELVIDVFDESKFWFRQIAGCRRFYPSA